MKGILTTILFFISCSSFSQSLWLTSDSIRAMAHEDKEIRMHIDSVYKVYGKDSPQWALSWKNMEESDKRHNMMIKIILSNHKAYPGHDAVGLDISRAFWTLVLHQDKDTALQKEVIALMKIQLDRKNVDPMDYAYLVDRYKVNTKQKQVYGTQCYFDPIKKTYVPQPIADKKNVDKRRKEMELPSMSDYLEILNDTTRIKHHQ
jgi:hypothetical protein